MVEGSVKFTSTGGGAGVSIDYKLFVPNNLLGPFSYHIHENPVPADGNCAGTGGHFDPFKVSIILHYHISSCAPQYHNS